MLRTARHIARVVRYGAEVIKKLPGTYPRECPCCSFRGKFSAFGHPPRYDAMCPECRSLERHRLFVLMDQRTPVFRPSDGVLQFAPEQAVAGYVRPRVASYRSADIEPGKADITLNIEEIDLPDGSVDVVIANHILEHVDDGPALRELHRILRPGGRLVAATPMVEAWAESYEDATITEPRDREVHFGQWDHIRWYGRDLRQRVADAGFRITQSMGSGADCVRYSLLRGEAILVGERA